MSRVGKIPVDIPSGVDVTLEDNTICVKGPKGDLSKTFSPLATISVGTDQVQVSPKDDSRAAKAQYGTTRSIIANMVLGVTKPYSKDLLIEGVGFRATVKGSIIDLELGYSHPVEHAIPEGVTITVADNVKIMAVRAVPDGDEYDKDIALGIRYAVDNGAKVINTSFGKYYSTHPEWVMDAIKYAAKNDVLIVNAAGNDALDMDVTRIYPNDQTPENEEEIADNFLTVGASNFDYGSDLVARFSNYGQTNVDVFAPGTKIWSTTPNNEYEFLQGTSMASPAVAGVAAMIRSLYPKLSAAQVKEVIMKSGLASPQKVMVGGNSKDIRPFAELSVSGKMVNLYNALIMASKM